MPQKATKKSQQWYWAAAAALFGCHTAREHHPTLSQRYLEPKEVTILNSELEEKGRYQFRYADRASLLAVAEDKYGIKGETIWVKSTGYTLLSTADFASVKGQEVVVGSLQEHREFVHPTPPPSGWEHFLWGGSSKQPPGTGEL